MTGWSRPQLHNGSSRRPPRADILPVAVPSEALAWKVHLVEARKDVVVKLICKHTEKV